jgi:2-polyprenyl-3-methyl-5-hydroxy-6-metoxy-1,4-benzoquinol methylase
MSSDPFQPADQTGLETLQLFAHAKRFNKWMYESIAPYCSGTVLEIGSGIGNISEILLENYEEVGLSDMREEYCSILLRRFGERKNLRGVFQIDLSALDFGTYQPELIGQFNTVIALNVIEHIEEDSLAIRNCRQFLKRDGRLVILVPAFPGLYNSLDKELGHVRRYTENTLSALLASQEMKVINTRYFNSPGIFGWWVSGSLFKKKIISEQQLRFYSNWVPVFRVVDKFMSRIAGLSVIAEAVRLDYKE